MLGEPGSIGPAPLACTGEEMGWWLLVTDSGLVLEDDRVGEGWLMGDTAVAAPTAVAVPVRHPPAAGAAAAVHHRDGATVLHLCSCHFDFSPNPHLPEVNREGTTLAAQRLRMTMSITRFFLAKCARRAGRLIMTAAAAASLSLALGGTLFD